METTDPAPDSALPERLLAVRERIADAADRAGRSPSEVRIVAVTKSVGPAIARALALLGVTDLGENRPQELLRKRAALEDLDVRWHMIGHLQTNKVRRLLPAIHLLHAGDRTKLLVHVAREAALADLSVPLLLQVNVSGEEQKGGFDPARVEPELERLSGVTGVRVAGLMTMAPWATDPESARPVFARLREMRDRLCDRGYLLGRELSMGMSGDFTVAVEEGATIVRLGRILCSA